MAVAMVARARATGSVKWSSNSSKSSTSGSNRILYLCILYLCNFV